MKNMPPTGGPTEADLLSQAQSQKFMRLVDAETGNVVQIELIDTGLTTVDGIPIFTVGVGSSGGGFNVIIVSKTIGEVTFTGAGVDDMINGGEFTGPQDRTFTVEIDLAAGTDTFRWSIDGGTTWEAEDVPITGNPQTLQEGVTIEFATTTGHTLGDQWAFTCLAADTAAVIKTIVDATTQSLAPLGTQTIGPIDLRNVSLIALTIATTFHASATLGLQVEAFTSADGVNYDVDPYASSGLEPTFVAGALAQKTSLIDVEAIRFIKFVVTNLDTVRSTVGAQGFVTKAER